MFTTKIIKIDTFTSKAGKPCKIAWFASESGLPCKSFISAVSPIKEGDSVLVSVSPDFNCNARIDLTLSK